MKLAVLSDIHGNLPALEAVLEHVAAWGPDQVIVNGDVVNRGPWPGECLRLLQQQPRWQGWELIRGNHEAFVLANLRPDRPRSGPAFEVNRHNLWTFLRLDGDIGLLQAMPALISLFTAAGCEARFTHASARSDRDSIMPTIADAELRQKIAPGPADTLPALFATAHTHRPFVRTLEQTLVVNSGSVGLPFDGDARAGYAQLCWQGGKWQARLVRLPYDQAAARKGFAGTGYLEEGGPLVLLVRRELELARPIVYAWERECRQPVLAGELGLEASVELILRRYGE